MLNTGNDSFEEAEVDYLTLSMIRAQSKLLLFHGHT